MNNEYTKITESVSLEIGSDASVSSPFLGGSTLGEAEAKIENELRPQRFADFAGQDEFKEKIMIFSKAARARKEALDHTLLCGPPGLGKTTMAKIIAEEMEVDCRMAAAPAIEKKGDLAALLTGLRPFSVLFIDEIHRLNRSIEEYLYTAMEDFYIDIIAGEGLGSRAMKFQLVPFTLVGATTRAGLLNAPFRDRFGIMERLQFYSRADLEKICMRSGGILDIEVTPEGAREVAKRARGTPRIVNRLLKRVRDYAQVLGKGVVNEEMAIYALDKLGVDEMGLDFMDRRILQLMFDKYNGGPVGIETLSAALSEEKGTLEEVYEPFLLQEGLVQKTPRGRTLTEFAKTYIQGKIGI